MELRNFISAEKLKLEIAKNDKLVILDARYDLHNKEYGQQIYEKEHMVGSHFIDLDKDLAGEKRTHGGARPLPELGGFLEKIENMGITKESSIVIYDEKMVVAARAFWMFKYIGHKDVKILDGGYSAWVENGGEVTSKKTNPNRDINKLIYEYTLNQNIYTEISQIKEIIKDENRVIVECRSHERYLGQNEPFYAKPGHIPSSICIDSKSLLEVKDLKIKSKEDLNGIFNRLEKYKDIVFSCGSGVNASLDYAIYNEFFDNGKVYIGSYSDWISYDENPIETKDEN